MLLSKSTAYVEQAAPTKPPTLHPGEISLAVMHEFEDGCHGCFDNKEIPPDNQVRKILPGLKDSHICDWIAAERERLIALSFTDFMKELHEGYLDPDWEDDMRQELGALKQGSSESFWEFSMQVQAMNSLLHDTTSHMDEKGLCNCLESGMDTVLAKCCNGTKLNEEKGFRQWAHVVKIVDEIMCAEQAEFETIAKTIRDTSHRTHPLGGPSARANTAPPLGNHTHKAEGGIVKLLKLMGKECQLLFDNSGCLKCRRFFVDHHSTNCLNEFPSAVDYHSLTQGEKEFVPDKQPRRSQHCHYEEPPHHCYHGYYQSHHALYVNKIFLGARRTPE
jgi:hypothetical protein